MRPGLANLGAGLSHNLKDAIVVIKKAQTGAKVKPAAAAPQAVLSQSLVSLDALNEKQRLKRKSKAQENVLKMRALLWPELNEARLWHRKVNDGFSTVPRTLPLLSNLINDLSKIVTDGKSVPAGRAYLVLWCRVWDEAMVKIDSEAVAAAEAGYVGERNVTTWREHLRVLKDLGFIDYKPGPAGPYQYVLLYNPYQIVEAQKGKIQSAMYTALYQRALEIGAAADFVTP